MRALIFIFIASLSFTANAYAQKITSVYTGLDEKSCKVIELDAEGAGWYRGICPGVGGYRLELTEGDLRQTINVVAPDKRTYRLAFNSISSAFSYTGAKAEWRMKGKKPVALIVRFNANEDVENHKKVTSYLSVTKITPNEVCVVDVIKAGKDQNLQARRSADNAATKPCKFVE